MDGRRSQFDIKIEVDGASPIPIPTHKIDNFKNGVGIEVEWNNKTEFYDRDLNNFRLLRPSRSIGRHHHHAGISELQSLFDSLGSVRSLRQLHNALEQAFAEDRRRRGRVLPAAARGHGDELLRSQFLK